jgi:hypothetical protein
MCHQIIHLKNKWAQLVCHVAKKYFALCHTLIPYKMDDVDF